MPRAWQRTGPEFDFTKFEGFAAPGSTQVPDVFFDKIMAHLSDVELRVLLYFFRRTFGFKKFSDNISISQMVNGIETRDGKTLDYGCGLSKSGVTKGLRGLLGKHLIVATRRSDAKRGNLPTNYALNMQGVRHSDDRSVPHHASEKDDAYVPPLSPGMDKGVSPAVDGGRAPDEQGLSLAVDTQDTVTNVQTDKIVNGANDHGDPVGRPATGPTRVISARALRSKYQLSDDQIGRVSWLVERQANILGSAERNHAHYVKRAAEAIVSGTDGILDGLLGEFTPAAAAIAVGSRPAYFHRMYAEALDRCRTTIRSGTAAGHTVTDPRHLFRPPDDEPSVDPRARIIADAEGRGFDVPEYIRAADTSTVSRWWAGLFDSSRNP